MAVNPNFGFPLLATDQADVIRIFLELVTEAGNRAGHASEIATDEPLGPRSDSDPTT